MMGRPSAFIAFAFASTAKVADGAIEAELHVITGATNELGYNRLSAR